MFVTVKFKFEGKQTNENLAKENKQNKSNSTKVRLLKGNTEELHPCSVQPPWQRESDFVWREAKTPLYIDHDHQRV